VRRVLRMGAPLPPLPGPARSAARAEPVQGLAAFVAASAAAPDAAGDDVGDDVGDDAGLPGPSGAQPSDLPGPRPRAADVLALLRPSGPEPEHEVVPSSLRDLLPGDPWSAPPADGGAAGERAPVPDDDPDDDPYDDDEEDQIASAAAVYEQVRERLRHELLVERERAALLAD
jgi:hypothetical protein